jgi:endonuclease/exonuclease/phosphatase family metal-dependent hydrolase
MEIKVMTYNIHHAKGMDKRLDLERIAKVISESDADIIGLNEVDKHFSKRSLFKDQISWLANSLGLFSAFGPTISLKSKQAPYLREYGNALLSRHPIITNKNYPFNFLTGVIEGRALLRATIQINNKSIDVSVTHFSLNPFLQRMQTNFIVNQLHKSSNSMIVVGDFNMKPGSRGWKTLTREYKDVWFLAGNGDGSTYPSMRPRSRLDYIFVSPNIKVLYAEVVTKLPNASDHLPLKANIQV